ncbi:hypothetical protein L6452_27966 [Arctium lappa]|uniref:Uncharacterized protein n=1 Tax=Arctium lappa TaxID=4217 RepID=A0ACB8ZXE8_ARCLA|nr:hypothetical protein L6452_27966 [Arctium lappa]
MNEAPFISLPIYTAATTTDAPPPPTMYEPINTSQAAPVIKRNKNPQPPLTIPAGCICFRLLCHASRIGGVIGKSGAVIKQLQQNTSAKIRVEDPPPGSDDRVISVVANCSVNRTLTFDEESNQENNGYVESSEYREVSAAQEALVRVYERILSVAAETDGGYFAPGGVVSCRLLADTALVGCVIGKGGKVVEKIRKDTGCRIRIFGQDKLPPCAMPTDEMVEIEGDILAIKKALVAIARRLQDCPPSDKARMVFGRPPYGATRETTLPNGHMDFSPARNLVSEPTPTSSSNHRPWETTLPNGYMDLLAARAPILEPTPTSSNNHAIGGRPLVSSDAEIAPPVDFRNPQSQYEIVFRILCSTDRVGGVIGKSGTIVRALQNESGASIVVEAPTSECDDRLITITAIESPESQNSAAQNAVILVFNRSVEAGYERGLDFPSARTPISARLLIMPNQIGCLLGKGGSIIADMRKVTGAVIKIVPIHEVSRCTSEADQVVLMTGEFVNVRDALYSVTGRLRNHLFSSRMYNGPKTRSSYGQGVGHTMATPQYLNQHASLTQSMDNLRLFNNVDRPSSSRPWESQAGPGNPMKGQDVDRGSTSVKGGTELGRGGRSAIVTNTTVEIVVPENVIGSIYGENGSNLTRLRQISGAKVVVHEPGSGTTDHTVIISGTPDETQSAQSLLQAFILADQQ